MPEQFTRPWGEKRLLVPFSGIQKDAVPDLSFPRPINLVPEDRSAPTGAEGDSYITQNADRERDKTKPVIPQERPPFHLT